MATIKETKNLVRAFAYFLHNNKIKGKLNQVTLGQEPLQLLINADTELSKIPLNILEEKLGVNKSYMALWKGALDIIKEDKIDVTYSHMTYLIRLMDAYQKLRTELD